MSHNAADRMCSKHNDDPSLKNNVKVVEILWKESLFFYFDKHLLSEVTLHKITCWICGWLNLKRPFGVKWSRVSVVGSPPLPQKNINAYHPFHWTTINVHWKWWLRSRRGRLVPPCLKRGPDRGPLEVLEERFSMKLDVGPQWRRCWEVRKLLLPAGIQR